MRMLLITDDVRAIAAKIVEYAQAHPYRPPYTVAPGDDPNLSMQIGTYRAVFCRTIMNGVEFRHLSVSVPGGLYPGPEAACLIASDLFGFTGWDETANRIPDDWACMPKQEPVICVEIAQAVGTTVPKAELN